MNALLGLALLGLDLVGIRTIFSDGTRRSHPANRSFSRQTVSAAVLGERVRSRCIPHSDPASLAWIAARLVDVAAAKERGHAGCFQFLRRLGRDPAASRVRAVAVQAIRRQIIASFRRRSDSSSLPFVIICGAAADHAADRNSGRRCILIRDHTGVVAVLNRAVRAGRSRIADNAADALRVGIAVRAVGALHRMLPVL